MGTTYDTPVNDALVSLKNYRRRIKLYERRYEISSEEMVLLLKTNYTRETVEILKWMQTYHVLKSLEKMIRTTGTPTTTTEQSTTNV